MSTELRERLKTEGLVQIDQAIAVWQSYRNNPTDFGDHEQDFFNNEHVISLIRDVVERFCPSASSFAKEMEAVLSSNENSWVKAAQMAAVATTLRTALEQDRLDSFEQLIHGELFSDFLDMAQHLLQNKYKDAGAVIAGSSLESHLRQLCSKNSIAVTEQKGGKSASKTGGRMNDDLRAANVYDANRNKIISSFLGTRNQAAHGKYEAYTTATVEAMIVGIRSFMADYPA